MIPLENPFIDPIRGSDPAFFVRGTEPTIMPKGLFQQRRIRYCSSGGNIRNETGEKISRKKSGGRKSIITEAFDPNSWQLLCPVWASSKSVFKEAFAEKRTWSWYSWLIGCKNTKKEMSISRRILYLLGLPFIFKLQEEIKFLCPAGFAWSLLFRKEERYFTPHNSVIQNTMSNPERQWEEHCIF